MRRLRLPVLALLLTFASLHCSSPEPSAGSPSAADDTVATSEWVPVASYLGSDDATGDQIFQMLRERGIASVACGSLGYTVSVAAPDAERARDILRAAIAANAMAPTASVLEESNLRRP